MENQNKTLVELVEEKTKFLNKYFSTVQIDKEYIFSMCEEYFELKTKLLPRKWSREEVLELCTRAFIDGKENIKE